MHDGAAFRQLDRVAEAMRQPCPDQILDHVHLERGPPDVRTEVRCLRGGAVLEVRMGQGAVIAQRADRGERPDGLLGDENLVGAAEQVVGGVLPDVADGGDTGRQSAQGVLESGWEADHVIAEVRLDGRSLAESPPLVGPDAWARLFECEVTLRLGHAHRPVEGESEPIDRVTVLGEPGVDLDEGRLGCRPCREPDMHVVHHVALVATPSLVLGL